MSGKKHMQRGNRQGGICAQNLLSRRVVLSQSADLGVEGGGRRQGYERVGCAAMRPLRSVWDSRAKLR